MFGRSPSVRSIRDAHNRTKSSLVLDFNNLDKSQTPQSRASETDRASITPTKIRPFTSRGYNTSSPARKDFFSSPRQPLTSPPMSTRMFTPVVIEEFLTT